VNSTSACSFSLYILVICSRRKQNKISILKFHRKRKSQEKQIILKLEGPGDATGRESDANISRENTVSLLSEL
jgi:hypothetical protein